MRIHVVGLGSIGSLISHHLRQSLDSSHAVNLIYKTVGYAMEAKRHGGLIVERDGVLDKSTGFQLEDIFSSKQFDSYR